MAGQAPLWPIWHCCSYRRVPGLVSFPATSEIALFMLPCTTLLLGFYLSSQEGNITGNLERKINFDCLREELYLPRPTSVTTSNNTMKILIKSYNVFKFKFSKYI
jgi:hypothetical protein